jgi:hypothetical protein
MSSMVMHSKRAREVQSDTSSALAIMALEASMPTACVEQLLARADLHGLQDLPGHVVVEPLVAIRGAVRGEPVKQRDEGVVVRHDGS